MNCISNRTYPGTAIRQHFRAVVFDMDGVLLDTEQVWQRAEARLCHEYDVVHGPGDVAATLGLQSLEACRHYARRFNLPEACAPQLERELGAMMWEELGGDVVPLPGVRELVGRLQGRAALAIASNSRRVLVERALAKAGFGGAFDVVASADDVRRPKPAPDIYGLVCRSLGVPPAVTLALEDSAVGARSAIAAGLTCWAITPAPLSPRLRVAAWMPSMTELLAHEDRGGSLGRPRHHG